MYCIQETHAHVQIILNPAFPAMWCSVSILQKKADLVLEDMAQEEDKEVKQMNKEVRKESQNKVAPFWPNLEVTFRIIFRKAVTRILQ